MNKIIGKIIINAFRRPPESVRQAIRLKNEFALLGADVEIFDDESFRSGILNGKLFSEAEKSDFIVYLDKDKYTSAVLDKLGVPTFNNHVAIRLCDDKAETFLALVGAGLNLPDTIFGALSYSVEDEIYDGRLKSIAEKLGYPIIVKECFGSMGRGVYKADDFVELKKIAEELKNKPHLFQKYLPYKFGTDARVIVIGGKAVCAIERKNENDFRSNVALGGRASALNLSDSFRSAAEKAAKTLNLDYCGVDLLYGANGEPFVCEINSNAFFEGMEKATGVNVASLYARHILNKIKSK